VGLERFRGKVAAMTKSMDERQSVTLGADFDEPPRA
jgi:hypothetical protein